MNQFYHADRCAFNRIDKHMKFVGMIRAKNEERWIERVIRSILPICERVVMMNDHSTDATAEIAHGFNQVTVYDSPFEGLNEVRDKDWLLSKIIESGGADYVLQVDGDEELESAGPTKIRDLCRHRKIEAASLRVVYLWDSPNQWRTDGIYGRYERPSLFKLVPGVRRFKSYTEGEANFHCSNVPAALAFHAVSTDIKLLHYGYMDAETRARKHEYYNVKDPGNELEDHYRHVTQGDPGGAPAHAKLKHAGPLTLEPLTH